MTKRFDGAVVEALETHRELARQEAISYTTCSRVSVNEVGRPDNNASTLSVGSPAALPARSCALVG